MLVFLKLQAGAAVAAAQVGMTAAISTVKAVNWGVMQNTSIVMDTLKDSANKCLSNQAFESLAVFFYVCLYR
jgi:hypothetical protein